MFYRQIKGKRRVYGQAPEVDGATVILSEKPLAAGQVVLCGIQGAAGFDLQAAAV